jgi:hypothetical protein
MKPYSEYHVFRLDSPGLLFDYLFHYMRKYNVRPPYVEISQNAPEFLIQELQDEKIPYKKVAGVLRFDVWFPIVTNEEEYDATGTV